MKYIRTKDGRISDLNKYENLIETETCYCVVNKEYKPNSRAITTMFRYKFKINKTDVIKQADTIKELCDEFVVIGYYKNKPLQFDTLEEAQRFVYEKGCQDKDYIGIYGAIWTDKGLIYVAEMNDNEELTLI